MKTVAEAVKAYNKKHETKQISLFDVYEIEDIIIKVKKK